MLRTFTVKTIAIGVLLGAILAVSALAQQSPSRAEIRGLRAELRASDARIDSLELRVAFLKRDSVIIASAHPDSLSAQLARNLWRYRTELAALTAPDYSLALLAGSVITGYAWGSVRRDPGGYADSWGTIDKEAHLATCAALYAGLRSSGAPRWLAFAAPLLAGLALETGQSRHGGHFSTRDLAANGVGCGLAFVIDRR